MTRLLPRLLLAAVLSAALCACSSDMPPTADPRPADQHQRAEVLEAFLTDPEAAARRYREVWDERGVSGVGDFTLLAIAQGMVQHRQGDPAPFLRFAQQKTRSPDPNVIEAALWVYSGDHGQDTLDALFGFLPDRRGTVSMSAESVIAYRRAAAREDPRRREDGARIAARLAAWCAEPAHAVRPLCLISKREAP